MRILMLNWRCPTNPKSGGAEYVTRKHLEAWALAGHEVHWLAGGYPGAKRYEKLEVSELTKKQCMPVILSLSKDPDKRESIHLHRYSTPYAILLLAPLLYWVKWQGNFDVVVDQIHGIPFFTPLWAWKSRKIAFIHEVAQEIWDEMWPFPISVLGKLFEKIYFWFYHKITFWTDSNSTRNDLEKFGVPLKNIHVIPCAIDLEPVREVPVKEEMLTLVFLGRMVKMKGIEDALSIVSEIKKTIPQVKLWVLGQGEPKYVSFLKKMTLDLGIKPNVDWKGWVSEKDKISYLGRAHYLLHTSVREGFGLTVLEANSQGTPVIAYNAPGMRDLIKPHSNGLFMQTLTTNPKKVILQFLQDTEHTKVCRSSLEIAMSYQWEQSLSHSFNLIESL